MTDQNKTPHPLDHATARIVTELAAALTPHLKETVSYELAKTIRSLPVDIDREVEEVLSSLRRIRVLADDMANVLSSAQNSASDVFDRLLPLSRACETMNEAAECLAQLTAERQSGTPQVNELLRSDELLRSLEAGFSDWKGVLKANGRAQTQELSEFSSEVSEQVGWMKSALPGIMEEILEKALSSIAEEWMKIFKENTRALETRLTKFEKTGKILLILGLVFLLLLGVLYFFK